MCETHAVMNLCNIGRWIGMKRFECNVVRLCFFIPDLHRSDRDTDPDENVGSRDTNKDPDEIEIDCVISMAEE